MLTVSYCFTNDKVKIYYGTNLLQPGNLSLAAGHMGYVTTFMGFQCVFATNSAYIYTLDDAYNKLRGIFISCFCELWILIEE